ncbi:MAG: TIGR04282 family arsenosugar biosynthesis glycosyltransferase [Candidatus Dormibacteria bacterium]
MNVLCVLARAPAPGTGKSRLRSSLDGATTDRLALAFLEDVLAWSGEAADATLVASTGPAWLLPPLAPRGVLVPQAEGGLGDRIAAAVDAAFLLGAGAVVILGSDCPTLPAALVEAAFTGLESAASTLIPAADGGWVALGVDRPLGDLLDGVTWSSPATARQTVAALRADGRAPRVLPPWYDIDEPGDLDRLCASPGEAARAPRTAAVLAGMRASVR